MDHTAIDAEMERFTRAVSPAFEALARYGETLHASVGSAPIARARRRFLTRARDEVAEAVNTVAAPETATDRSALRDLLRVATRAALVDVGQDLAHVGHRMGQAIRSKAERALVSARTAIAISTSPAAKFFKDTASHVAGRPRRLGLALAAFAASMGMVMGVHADDPLPIPAHSISVDAELVLYEHPFELRAPTMGFYDGKAPQLPTERFYGIALKALSSEMGHDAALLHVETVQGLAEACMERQNVCSVHTKGLSVDPLRGLHGISMTGPDGSERLVLTEERGVVRVQDYGLYAQLSAVRIPVEETPSFPAPH